MKTHLYSLGLSLSLALLGGVLSAAPAPSPALMYPVAKVWSNDMYYLKVGVSDFNVTRHLGEPLYKPAEDVWVYHRYSASLAEANQADCHNLLLTFRGGRVASIKLVNDRAVKVITALAREKGSIALPPTVFLTNN